MKKSILVALAAISFVACNNDDDNVSSSNAILPVKLVSTNVQDKETSTVSFSYNGDKLSTITGTYGSENNKMTFEYTGDLITKVTSVDGTDKDETVYTYTNGKLTSSVLNGSESNGTYINTASTNYTYNSDGTVAATEIQKHTKPSDPTFNYTNTINYIYTITNGQITKKIVTYISTPNNHVETASYTYDTKNSVFKNVRGFNALLLGLNQESIGENFSLSQNNYLTITTLEGTSTSNSQYSHEYNANGYPTKTIETYNGSKLTENIITYNK